MMKLQYNVLALDLEGTLVSNAMSAYPRPGLKEFLTFCHEAFDRVVLYTTIGEIRARSICRVLAEEGSAPDWFSEIEYVEWEPVVDGKNVPKDLRRIPNADASQCLIVDDIADYILSEQKEQWVAIRTWGRPERFDVGGTDDPYPADDRELYRVREVLLAKLAVSEDC